MNWYCHVLTQFGLMNLNVVLRLLAEIIWTILLLWMYVDCLYLVMLLGLKDTNVIIKQIVMVLDSDWLIAVEEYCVKKTYKKMLTYKHACDRITKT